MVRTLLLGLVAVAFAAAGPSPSPPHQVPEARPWTRWWWPGSAVTPDDLTRQLEAFARVGLGGVEITPIYGARGAEDRYREFLSPAWQEALRHTVDEANRLGLQVDMATGTGWPFGGPHVATADASQRIVWHADPMVLSGEPTDMTVKRAAPGGEGRVLDPYSPAALQRYLARFSPALLDLPAPGLRAQFHDSFEYYGATWTDALPAAFLADHDYDLHRHGAALVAEPDAVTTLSREELARLKHDYRFTLGRLHLQYLDTWRAWAHRHGWLVRNQSHGAPANLLDLYGAVDIPETETFGSTPFPIPGLRREDRWVKGEDDLPAPLMMRMASSAAHVMGRPRVSSETATWLREHWQTSLAMVKPEIDRLFAHGINHLFYHGTVYSPPDAAWPGWLFYASTQFTPANPWWRDFGALNAYVTRVQTHLQAGSPDNDVLLYWPYADVISDTAGLTKLLTVHHVDWLTDSDFGHVARRLQRDGFTFDYISDAQLQLTSARPDGDLQTPGQTYRALVVPPVHHLPLPTLQHLRHLAAKGAAITFLAAPQDVPGLANLPARRATFASLLGSSALQGALTPPADLSAWLRRHGAVVEPMANLGLEFARRQHSPQPGRTTYFITNLTSSPLADWLELGRRGASIQATDPLTGRVWQPALRGSTPWVDLAPGQSILLTVAPRHEITPAATAVRLQPAAALELTGPWRIEFISGGPALPAAVSLDSLADWTTLPDPAAPIFAGTARYRTTFDLSDPTEAVDWRLDLGDVRESARVRLNGREIAVSWSLPHQVNVGTSLRPGTNELEIEVTNLAANRIRDLDRRGVPWRIMHEINFVDIRYQPFDASAWPLAPSGLLGPVRLVPLIRHPDDR